MCHYPEGPCPTCGEALPFRPCLNCSELKRLGLLPGETS